MTKISLSTITQELRDFKEFVKSDLSEIKEYTQKTNGSVTKALTQIALLEQFEDNCPARLNYNEDKKISREWIMWVPSAIAVIIAIIALFK